MIFFFFNYTECLSLWPALLIFPRKKTNKRWRRRRRRERGHLRLAGLISFRFLYETLTTWLGILQFGLQQRTRMCECICEIHSTTNMILCVCYETIAHATSRHMPPCLHAWPCQGVIIVNTRISNCFCSASRGMCVFVFVIRARL